jgi:hypothetical protein
MGVGDDPLSFEYSSANIYEKRDERYPFHTHYMVCLGNYTSCICW